MLAHAMSILRPIASYPAMTYAVRVGLGDTAQEACLTLRFSDKHFIDDRKIEDATSEIRFHERRLDKKGRRPQTACAKSRK